MVGSGKGGSGKTTTVRNLAVAATQAGLSVTTVDLDESPTLTRWSTRRPGDLTRIEHISKPLAGMADEDSLYDFVRAIRGTDLVLVDTPPSLPEYKSRAKELLKTANLLVIPTQQYDEDLEAALAWGISARDNGIATLTLLNRTLRREKSFEYAKRRLVKMLPLCPIDIPHFADIPKSFVGGMGVSEIKGAKGGADYEAVIDHIRSVIQGVP